ncbi:MAG: hypothetical protein ACI8Z5_000662 [Lentimonas sp.]|jgi:hypothetical protein
MNIKNRSISTCAFAVLWLVIPLSAETRSPDVTVPEPKAAQALRDPFHKNESQVTAPKYMTGPANVKDSIFVDIKLKGAFIMKGHQSRALVHVGDQSAAHIVRVGDVIPLHTQKRQTFALGNGANQQDLVVQEIQPDRIVVAPTERPEELIVIR